MSNEFDDVSPKVVVGAKPADAEIPQVESSPSEPAPAGGEQQQPVAVRAAVTTPEANQEEFKSRMRSKVASAALLSWIALSVSILTSVVSITATWFNYRSQQDIYQRDIIRSQYGIYYDINKLEIAHPQLSHIFALPEWYDESRRRVCEATSGLDEVKKSELRIQERAVARIIFTHYEQTLIQRDEATKAHFAPRAHLLDDDLEYYAEKMLRNPRLRYLWSKGGGGLGADFTEATQIHYDEKVVKGSNLPPEDSSGPFEPKQCAPK